MNKEKVILGEWDGQPIWRWRTAEEQLLKILWEEEQLKLQENVTSK